MYDYIEQIALDCAVRDRKDLCLNEKPSDSTFDEFSRIGYDLNLPDEDFADLFWAVYDG